MKAIDAIDACGLPPRLAGRSVEVELGCGTGELLAELAMWHPSRNYVGVELDRGRAHSAMARIRRRRLKNVRVIHGEAQDLVSKLPPRSVDVIHVYHPTPYPSAVGLRYRLVTAAFEVFVYRALRPWGHFRLATDHADYYCEAIANFGPHRWWATDWRRDAPALARGALVGSPVEMEYRYAGVKEFYATELVALPAPSQVARREADSPSDGDRRRPPGQPEHPASGPLS